MNSRARCSDCGYEGITEETLSYDQKRKTWRCKGGCWRKPEGHPLNALKAITDVVMAYRPKPKSKAAKKRRKNERRHGHAKANV